MGQNLLFLTLPANCFSSVFIYLMPLPSEGVKLSHLSCQYLWTVAVY